MKKVIILVLVVFILNMFLISDSELKNKKFSFTIGAGVRGIAADHFSDIFSDTNICYSIDFAYRIIKSGELFLHSDYLSIEGETDYTKEKTTFSLIPVELGFRFLFGKTKLVPYLGAGIGYYSITDEHPELGKLTESRVGFLGEGGLKFNFSNSFFVDLKLKYIMLNSENDTDLGGLTYILGIGFKF